MYRSMCWVGVHLGNSVPSWSSPYGNALSATECAKFCKQVCSVRVYVYVLLT